MKQTKLSLADRIAEKISSVHSLAQEIPGVVMIHNMRDLTIEYMSPRGLKILGVTLQELVEMGSDYYQKFFNADETKEQVPKMIGLLERNNDDEIIALFQQVRRSIKENWDWYCTSLKIFMRDDEGKPLLTIAIAIPIDPNHNLSDKISRLLEENNFLRQNSDKFHELSNREKEVLKHLALAKSSTEIAEEIHISPHTVDTHRKNIKQKLGTNSMYELAKYALAFGLI